MPVFNVSLQFDNKGAVTAVNAFNDISRAADSAGKSVDGATAKMRTHGAAIKETTANVKQLAAQVVGLVTAYKALDTAKGFVQRGIEYASSLEDAQTSIASIIMATNKVSTAQGKTLEGADAFNASLEISKNLMDEMQVLALESTATFDSLVQGVSGIIAPATKAGVSLEKLPKFAVTAAQAMQTMKIPVEQMRTEIESLLSGNINKAQDLLATNLGISGEMVKNWKAQGTLVQELEKRLMAFALAGERVVNSWSGLKSNMSDALDYLGKVTGEGIFENIKQSYRELLQLILDTDSGKPGISSEFENVAGLIRDIQDAIGEGILDLTRDLIDELKELNKPENIAEVKRAFAEFKDVAVELFDTVTKVTSAITSFVATSMQGWSNMPDIIQEMGIVGAVLLGKKGKLALLAVGQMDNFVRGLMATASGEMSFSEFAALPGGEEGRKILDALEGKGGGTKAPAMAVSHGGGEVTPSKPAPSGPYKTMAAISDAPKKVSASATNARQKIEELRREIEVLNGESSKAGFNLANKLDDIAKAGKAAGLSVAEVGALQHEYKDAFQAKTLDDFNKQLLQAQGNTSALKEIQIGETLRDWQQQFESVGMSAEQYGPKIAELRQALEQQQDYKDIQTAAKFYEELAELSGDYGESLTYQNQLIDQQAQLWQQAGIPLADVQKRVELMREDLARDPFSGFTRGARKWATETMDYAANIENALTSAFDSAADALAEFALTGKMNFNDLGNSILQMLAKIGAQQALGGIVGGLTSGLSGLFGGGLVSQAQEVMSFIPGIAHSGWHVGYERPTDGFRSVPAAAFAGAPRFHDGGGYFAPDEYPAILQRGERVLNRDETRAYHAGMASSREPQVNVVINNTTGEQVSTQKIRDGNGNTRIDVMVGNVAAQQAAKPGSNLNRAIRGTTGARQSVIGR